MSRPPLPTPLLWVPHSYLLPLTSLAEKQHPPLCHRWLSPYFPGRNGCGLITYSQAQALLRLAHPGLEDSLLEVK